MVLNDKNAVILAGTDLRYLRLLCPWSDEARENRHSCEGPEGGC